MNKKTIITILLALVAMAGQGQNWSPLVEDSIDFIITGTTNSTQDSLIMFPCAPLGVREKYPIRNGKFTVTGRVRRHTFIQIDDNVNNSLRFIAEETPTYINLATDEVRGSELQKKFISCQMRERDIYNKTDRNAVIQQNIRENMDNIIPAYYLYSDYPSFTLEEMQEFIREDAPYARHPAMEWPWRAYLAKLKQKDITGKPFIDPFVGIRGAWPVRSARLMGIASWSLYSILRFYETPLCNLQKPRLPHHQRFMRTEPHILAQR